ncbi:hypothetical protein [Kineococcus sp. SYSU DK002]|uniref:hypothetical protein n=1 Tax=Kineococcus sp. SYSU DK002 TaxID=3383123 RepID=UPI003D7D8B4E
MPSDSYRPTVVSIAAEYEEDAYAWDHSPGEVGHLPPSILADMGADPDLLARLSAWNDTYGQLAVTDFQWRAEQSEAEWGEEGLQLALELQRQLPDIEVYYGNYGAPDPSCPSLRQQLGLPPLPAVETSADEHRSGLYAYAPLSGATHRPHESGATSPK